MDWNFKFDDEVGEIGCFNHQAVFYSNLGLLLPE